ncbi:hypothetical protein V6N13_074877 [Hibiscus sabdariffa]|uniref:Uncharacterized protein n=2 Tax=Hibiscus sabdariffa TaxID=183260 RepID=A0ABR1ZLQ3_9ROSI
MDLEPPQQVRLQQLKLQVQLQQNLHIPMFLDGCPPPTVRTSQESSVSHSSPSPTPIPTQPSHSNVFSWMPTPRVPLSQDNCGSQSSPRIDP